MALRGIRGRVCVAALERLQELQVLLTRLVEPAGIDKALQAGEVHVVAQIADQRGDAAVTGQRDQMKMELAVCLHELAQVLRLRRHGHSFVDRARVIEVLGRRWT